MLGVGRLARENSPLAKTSGVRRCAFSYDSSPPLSATHSLELPDSTTNRGKAHATAIQDLRFVPQYRSPCICRCARCPLPASPSAASHRAPRCPADRAPPPSASRSPLPSLLHHIRRRTDSSSGDLRCIARTSAIPSIASAGPRTMTTSKQPRRALRPGGGR